MNIKRLDAIEQRVGAHCPFRSGHWKFGIVVGAPSPSDIGAPGSNHRVTDRQGNTVPITPEVEVQIGQFLKSGRMIDLVVHFSAPEPNIDIHYRT